MRQLKTRMAGFHPVVNPRDELSSLLLELGKIVDLSANFYARRLRNIAAGYPRGRNFAVIWVRCLLRGIRQQCDSETLAKVRPIIVDMVGAAKDVARGGE